MKGINKHIYLFLLMLMPAILWAVDPDSQFELANEAYANKAYDQAIELYEGIVKEGKESAFLFYNLGNAHYKFGNVAESILNFERALRINPTFEDAKHNLRMANLRVIDNIDPLPELMLVSWTKNFYQGLSSRQWAYVSIALFWLALISGAVFLFVNVSAAKRIGFFGGLILLLLGLISTSLSFARQKSELNTQFGIISESTAYIKNAPSGDQDLLVLHEGAKVEILEASGNWTKVRILGVGIDVVGFVKSAEITGI